MVSRLILADAIESYLKGKIDNRELDNILVSVNVSDLACRKFAREMARFIDDFVVHTHAEGRRLKPRYEAGVRRWLEFLRTKTEWSWPAQGRTGGIRGLLQAVVSAFLPEKTQFTRNEFWPFQSEEEWKQWRQDQGIVENR